MSEKPSTQEPMQNRSVQKQYMLSMLTLSVGYVGSLLGVTILIKTGAIEGQGTIALLTLIPGFFVFGMIWAMWRYLRDMDEVQRHFLVQCMMLGLFAVLIVSGVWGLIEMMAEDLPRLPIFWVFPGFFFVFGLATCFGPGRGMGLR